MLATTTNPADGKSWRTLGIVFQPDHTGSNRTDCRDPMVIKVANTYYLYYTGRDAAGGIVGVAAASSLAGPWRDWGPVLTEPGTMLESPTVVGANDLYYFFYNDTTEGGERYRIGFGPTGPWAEERVFGPGWAHEIWTALDGSLYTSYLTDYSVTISRLTWDHYYVPARPFVGANVYHVLLPMVMR